jgi:uncharacterized protein
MDLPKSFPPEVAKNLGSYVYRLVDPRNGETFYVGKGEKNRVFDHIRRKLKDDDALKDNLKFQRIQRIQKANLQVVPVIHRHGMNDAEARQVEAALIYAYPGRTNAAPGIGGDDYRPAHPKELIHIYGAKEADFKKHKALLICIKITANDDRLSYYNATRYCWSFSKDKLAKANEADVILPFVKGIIVDAFVADGPWLPATVENFPELANGKNRPKRFGFKGHPAPDDIRKHYVDRRVSQEFRYQWPTKFTW